MNEPVHIAITRTVKAGCEEAFERALHNFVQRSLPLPGQLGVQIFRPAPGSNSLEYGIIRKFADREAVAAFRTSPEYLEWNQFALDLTEGSGRAKNFAAWKRGSPCPATHCARCRNGRWPLRLTLASCRSSCF